MKVPAFLLALAVLMGLFAAITGRPLSAFSAVCFAVASVASWYHLRSKRGQR